MFANFAEDEAIFAEEFFHSGTIAECCSLEYDRWMKDGDLIEVEFEKLGISCNRFARRAAREQSGLASGGLRYRRTHR